MADPERAGVLSRLIDGRGLTTSVRNNSMLRSDLGIQKSGLERPTVQSCLAANKPGFRRSQTPRPNSRCRCAFLFRVRDLVRHFRKTASVFCGVKSVFRVEIWVLKALPAEWAQSQKLRPHLGLIKTSLGIKNT